MAWGIGANDVANAFGPAFGAKSVTVLQACCIAAATWLLVASKLGLPVSTTHSAVGGVIAIAISSKGYDSVKWEKVGMIIASWFISPVMSAVAGFVLYSILYQLVLRHADSLR